MQNDGKSLFTSHGGPRGDPHGETVMATEYARGPWDTRACHGGPVSALLVRAAEALDDGSIAWQLARITVDLVRPVPVLVPLRLSCAIERPGRLVSLVGCSLATEDGFEVAKATVLRVRRAEVDLTGASEPEPVFAEPGVGSRERSTWTSEETAFHKDAVELVFSEGAWDVPGPVAMWCRLVVPLFDGEEPSGAQRSMCAADFSNGVSSELEAETMLFINPDLTVHLLRPPVGEWIGVRARSHYGVEGAGLADTALYDELGRVGRAAQSLLLAPR